MPGLGGSFGEVIPGTELSEEYDSDYYSFVEVQEGEQDIHAKMRMLHNKIQRQLQH